MIGFTFANKHSSELGVIMKSVNRTITPSLRKNEFVIPGRHGTLDYGLNTYENRFIGIELNLVKTSLEDLRQQARDVARWLSRDNAMLIFDDELNKAYQAKTYENIDIEQIVTAGISEIIFECQPFAESLEYRQEYVPSIIEKSKGIDLDVKGTSESCPIITIKNIGSTSIKNIIITRKAMI